MRLELYKALKAITIPEALVDATIDAMDTYIESHIGSSTAALLAKMDALGAGMAAGLSVTNTKVDASASVTNAKLDADALVKGDADRQKDLRTLNRRWLATYAITVIGFAGTMAHNAGVF